MADETRSAPSGPAPAPRRRRRGRRLLAVLLVLLILLGAAVVLLPTLLSTGPGTGLALGIVNRLIPGTIEVDDLTLAWSRGQSLRGLRLHDADGSVVLTVDAVEAPEASLRRLALGDRNVGTVTVERLQGALECVGAVFAAAAPRADRETAGRAPSAGGRGSGAGAEPMGVILPAGLRGKVQVVDGAVSYAAPTVERVEIMISRAVVDMLAPRDVNVSFASDLRQAGHAGAFEAEFKIANLFDDAGRLTVEDVEIEGQAKAADVPTVVLDVLLQQDGLLLQLLGTTVQVDIKAHGSVAGTFEAAFTVHSERLAANGEMRSREGQLHVLPGATAELHVQPASWEALAARITSLAGVTLLEPFDLQVRVDELAVPVAGADGRLDLVKATAGAHVEAGTVVLDAGEALGPLRLMDTVLDVSAATLGSRVDLKMQARAEQGGHQGRIELTADVRDPLDATGTFNRAGLGAVVAARLVDVPTALLDQFAGEAKGVAAAAVGPKVTAELNSEVAAGTGLSGAVPYRLSVVAGKLRTSLGGSLDLDRMAATATGTVDLRIEPTLVELLVKLYGAKLPDDLGRLGLAAPSEAKLTLTDLAMPLKAFDVNAVSGGLVLTVDQLAPTGIERLGDTRLQAVTVEVPAGARADALPFDARARLAHGGSTADLTARGTLGGIAGPRRLDLEVAAQALPVALLERLLALPGELVPFTSDRIDSVTLTLRPEPGAGDRLQIGLVAQAAGRLEARIRAGYVSQRSLVLSPESSLRLVVPPATFAWWLKRVQPPDEPLPWRLLRPTTFDLVIGEADLGLRQAPPASGALGALDAARTRVDLSFTAADVAVQRTEPPADLIELKRLVIHATGDDLRKPITCSIHSEPRPEQQDPGAQPRVSIQSHTTVASLFDTAGTFTPGATALDTNTRLVGLPVDLVDRLAEQDGWLSALLGPSADLSVTGGYRPGEPADLDVLLHATHARTNVAARVGDEAVLRENGDVELAVTPELSALLLRKLNPVISAVEAAQPIKAVIQARNFRVPVRDFDFAKVSGDFDIELGTLELDRSATGGGQALGLLVGLLAKVSDLDTGRGMRHTAAFSPISVHLENGVVSYRDMTMALDGIVMTFRGQVDVPRDRVALMLGLSGQTFAKNKKIGRYFRPEDRFEIPMTGRVDKVALDGDGLIQGIFQLAAKRGFSELVRGRESEPWAQIVEGLFGGGGTAPAPPPAEAPKTAPEATGADMPAETATPTPAAEQPPSDPIQRVLWELQQREKEKKRKKEADRERRRQRRQAREKAEEEAAGQAP